MSHMSFMDNSKAPNADEDDRLAEAFQRLRPRLIGFIGRRIGSELAVRIDPEGVIHEAYVRALPRWQGMTAKPDTFDVEAFVYRQVLDRLIELTRSALGPERDVRKTFRSPNTGAGDELADHFVDSHTGPKSALSRAERREVVRAALAQLDPVDREILALRYFDGLSFKQIGEILNLKENTANTRALRAAVRFRQLIPPAFRPPRSEPR